MTSISICAISLAAGVVVGCTLDPTIVVHVSASNVQRLDITDTDGQNARPVIDMSNDQDRTVAIYLSDGVRNVDLDFEVFDESDGSNCVQVTFDSTIKNVSLNATGSDLVFDPQLPCVPCPQTGSGHCP
jgi:hypothetical protein